MGIDLASGLYEMSLYDVALCTIIMITSTR